MQGKKDSGKASLALALMDSTVKVLVYAYFNRLADSYSAIGKLPHVHNAFELTGLALDTVIN
jgi:hypothetical protein